MTIDGEPVYSLVPVPALLILARAILVYSAAELDSITVKLAY